MTDWMQVLGSSNIDAVRYDEAARECYVRFHGGAMYAYEGVGPGIWEELQNSTSKGRFVQIQLRRAHTYRRLPDYVEESVETKKRSES